MIIIPNKALLLWKCPDGWGTVDRLQKVTVDRWTVNGLDSFQLSGSGHINSLWREYLENGLGLHRTLANKGNCMHERFPTLTIVLLFSRCAAAFFPVQLFVVLFLILSHLEFWRIYKTGGTGGKITWSQEENKQQSQPTYSAKFRSRGRDRTAQGRRVLPPLYPTRPRGEGL